jgi:hypothetical protein
MPWHSCQGLYQTWGRVQPIGPKILCLPAEMKQRSAMSPAPRFDTVPKRVPMPRVGKPIEKALTEGTQICISGVWTRRLCKGE